LARDGSANHCCALTEEAGNCCGGSGGKCCGQAGGKCACARDLTARGNPLALTLLAMAGDEAKKGDAQKDKEEIASEEAMAKGKAARKALLEHQKALAGDKVFGCCLKTPCAFCSNSADMCPCGMNVSKGDPVCPECWGGWQAGKGGVPGVKAEDVKI